MSKSNASTKGKMKDSMQRIGNRIKQRDTKVIVPMVIFVLAGGVGVYLLANTNAASPTASVETESGQITSPAQKVNDSTAASGSAIRFGQAVSEPKPEPTPSNAIIESDFESATVASPMQLSDYKAAMGGDVAAYNGNMVNVSVRSEAGKGKYMRQALPANAVGGGSGLVTFPKLPQTLNEAAIEYDVRFVGNFDWSGGGKLPGLGGATDGKPGVAAGCNDGVSTAWSGRGMWIGPKTHGSVTGSNEWIGYMYNTYKNSACGDNVRTRKAFSENKWHTIKQYYKMNSVGSSGANADGIHKMWLDGTQVINNTNVRYRDNTNLKINYIFWSIFRGGSDDLWSSPNTHYIDFDNIRVTPN